MLTDCNATVFINKNTRGWLNKIKIDVKPCAIASVISLAQIHHTYQIQQLASLLSIVETTSVTPFTFTQSHATTPTPIQSYICSVHCSCTIWVSFILSSQPWSLVQAQETVVVPEPINVEVEHVVRRAGLAPLVDTEYAVGVIAILADAMQLLGVHPVLC